MTTPITVTNEAPAPGLLANRLAAEGLVSEPFSRLLVSSHTTLTGGTAYGVLVPVYPGQVLTNAVVQVQAAASSQTLGKVGLYSLDGTTRYAATANVTTAWQTTGTKVTAFASAYTVAAGVVAVYAVVVADASTTVVTLTNGPAMQTGGAAVGSGAYPVVTGGTGLSDLPAAPVTFTASVTLPGFWIGLS